MELKITRYPNGNIQYERYLINGKRHREDGPAFIKYWLNGNVELEYYYTNGVLNRNDGPAIVWYDDNNWVERDLNGNQ